MGEKSKIFGKREHPSHMHPLTPFDVSSSSYVPEPVLHMLACC